MLLRRHLSEAAAFSQAASLLFSGPPYAPSRKGIVNRRRPLPPRTSFRDFLGPRFRDRGLFFFGGRQPSLRLSEEEAPMPTAPGAEF
jgi:hypothetical protein